MNDQAPERPVVEALIPMRIQGFERLADAGRQADIVMAELAETIRDWQRALRRDQYLRRYARRGRAMRRRRA